MTDMQQSVTLEPAPQLTTEQFHAVKESLLNDFIGNYHNFMKKLTSLPVARTPMLEAFRFFDTAFLWFKESIVHMPMPQVQVANVPQPEAPSEPTAPQENESAPEANPA